MDVSLLIKGNSDKSESLAFSNGFIYFEFDLSHPSINVLKADLTGNGNFQKNLFSSGSDPLDLNRQGIVLERQSYYSSSTEPKLELVASSMKVSKSLRIDIIRNTSSEVIVQISGIYDCADTPLLNSIWVLKLLRGDPFFTLDVVVEPTQSKASIVSSQLSMYLPMESVYGFFDRGVVQMMDSLSPIFFTGNKLNHFYSLGGGGCVEAFLSRSENHIRLVDFKQNTLHQIYNILLNSAIESQLFRSGLQTVLIGKIPCEEEWSNSTCWKKASTDEVLYGDVFNVQWKIWANNFDFPLSPLSISDLDTSNLNDIRAMLTSIYGTSSGTLMSFNMTTPGEIGVTISHPQQSYSNLFNFFDPDSYFSISAFMYSGDRYLFNEARKIIERSEAAMLPSGQIPHHFMSDVPIYYAISGATQTGPNCFWILSALQYVKNSGDYSWLREHMPKIELALSFLTNMYDNHFGLINAPGPLWIDVFIRNNFSSDTNAFMVKVLREMSEAEEFLGDYDHSIMHQQMAKSITEAINRYLWDKRENDHYVTQMNPDGTVRDFIDYDSNLLCVALGIANASQAVKVLERIDRGKCTHARPTYVSEKYYGPQDCYANNTGDSTVTMARIGWADGHARKRMNDQVTFSKLIISPVMSDLFEKIWLPERYTCEGEETHNPFYHGYPEMLVMLLREVAYGINIGLMSITIDPFTRNNFTYSIDSGNMVIFYHSHRVFASNFPGSGPKSIHLYRLIPSATYLLYSTHSQQPVKLRTDQNGSISFIAEIGLGMFFELVME